MSELRLPPASIDAEQAILGSILISEGTTQRVREAFDLVRPEMFYQHSHQLIYSAMLKMKNSEIDLITLTDQMEKDNTIFDAGGFGYVAELMKNTPSSVNILSYVDVVKDKFQAREIISIANNAAEQKYDGVENQDVVDSLLRNVEAIDMSGAYEPVHIKTHVDALIQRMDDKTNGKVEAIGRKTGIHGLDDQIGGIKPTWLTVIAGRPSHGKTIIKQLIATHIALDAPILNFSMEMDDDETVERYACIGAGVCAESMRTGLLTDYEWSRFNALLSAWNNNSVDILIDSTPGLALNQIKARAKATIKKYPNLAAITIDYLGLMKLPKADRHDLSIAEVTRGLKELAKEIRVPIFLLVQANRATDGKRPAMSNLADSASIERDADLIFFVHREDVYKEDTPFKGVTELIPAKFRHGTFNRTVYLKVQEDDVGGRFYTMPMDEVGRLQMQESDNADVVKRVW